MNLVSETYPSLAPFRCSTQVSTSDGSTGELIISVIFELVGTLLTLQFVDAMVFLQLPICIFDDTIYSLAD